MTTDERAMGVFILPLLVALQTIPAIRPGVEDRAAVLQGPLFGSTSRRCCLRTRASRSPA